MGGKMAQTKERRPKLRNPPVVFKDLNFKATLLKVKYFEIKILDHFPILYQTSTPPCLAAH